MIDEWTDRKRKTLINFLVYCPKGTIFLKFVDASHASKSINMLFKLLKDVVLRVGHENIVHVVMDNVANYGKDLTVHTMTSTLPATQLPAGVLYAALPVAGIMIIFYTFTRMLEKFTDKQN